jgi:hypothetical protein
MSFAAGTRGCLERGETAGPPVPRLTAIAVWRTGFEVSWVHERWISGLRTAALVAAAASLLAAWPAPAAAAGGVSRWGQSLDASIALASGRGTAAISWNHLYAAWPDRLSLGIGARVTTLVVDGPLAFRTGDAALDDAGAVNRLVLDDARVTSLNLQVLAIVRVAGPLEAGFDLDLAGFSFGPRRRGRYEATDPRFAGVQEAKVARLDLFRAGIRDRGQLNSEFFVGARLGPTWTVRAGIGHAVTGYRSAVPLDHGNRDFKRFTTQGFVGVSARVR